MNRLFDAGYYEWLVFRDDNPIYTFGDLIEDIPYPCSHAQMETVVDNLMELMQYDLQSDDFAISEDDKEYLLSMMSEIRFQMIDRLYYEYGGL